MQQVMAPKQGNGNREFLTYRQTAELLGVCERKVWELVNRGEIPKIKFGRSVRVRRSDVEKFLSGCVQGVEA